MVGQRSGATGRTGMLKYPVISVPTALALPCKLLFLQGSKYDFRRLAVVSGFSVMGSYIIKEMRSRRGVKELQQQTLLFIVVNFVSAAVTVVVFCP